MKRKDAHRTTITPATLSELVDLSDKLLALVVEEDWVLKNETRKEVGQLLDALALAYGTLPMFPKGQRRTVAYRLARAEAETLYGSCMRFERLVKSTLAAETVGDSDSEMERVAEPGLDLHTALCRFMVLADGL